MAKKPLFLNEIEKLKKRYGRAFKDKESLERILQEAEVPEHVYNSNAIENSTLTLEETENILMQIELERYITERELFEAKNLARVMEYVRNKKDNLPLSDKTLLLLHRMLIANIRDDIAGRFRYPNEWVRVGSHIAPDPKKVSRLLKKMWDDLATSKKEHIVKQIARLHLTFEYIHPFCDGNGRIGRVLSNIVLLQKGFVPINIAFANRKEYYSAFAEFNETQKTSIMEGIIGRALTESYHKRLAYAERKSIILLKEYGVQKKIAHSNLINKAHRQTIPAFRERGVWKIGV